jgi:hypothetical protein
MKEIKSETFFPRGETVLSTKKVKMGIFNLDETDKNMKSGRFTGGSAQKYNSCRGK